MRPKPGGSGVRRGTDNSPYGAYGNSCGRRTTVDAFCVDLYPPAPPPD